MSMDVFKRVTGLPVEGCIFCFAGAAFRDSLRENQVRRGIVKELFFACVCQRLKFQLELSKR